MHRIVLAAGLAAALFPAVAHADYGAIAFSQQTGAVTYSYSAGSKGSADSAALKRCRRYGGGCFIAIRFRNACGAIAVGSEWGYGISWADNREDAGWQAMSNCNEHDDGCEIRQRVCSG
ncbi:MAG TPA: DUF4189 domain-containing protein [Mesorhizobium sp.]|jgi:serine/threonine-protein kinase|nr:DUF4189 domain-containing protein [Mesorhizobium sp.]